MFSLDVVCVLQRGRKPFFDLNSSVSADEATVAAAQSDESVVDRSYVKKKLEHGLTRIWQVRF